MFTFEEAHRRSNCAENIRKHILHTGKHEGVKMYNCPKCDYGTNVPVEFRNHLKELHPDIENPDLAYLHAVSLASEKQGYTGKLQSDYIINKGQNCDPISCNSCNIHEWNPESSNS
ncbi:mitogen-activated protein kinase 4 [Platysternon megacephalum]|uniref:Mitogen-activated protein kinase 4 n=1 Tax=Platysternon megacephalum TaxID=55544 RepID=A0A4D9ENU8_9SAUR|nr:mitogen-activated protein kinase 4 [Platysternon megacephalum]